MEEKKRENKHFNITDRKRIQYGLEKNYTKSALANFVNRSRQACAKEILKWHQNHGEHPYNAEMAHEDYLESRRIINAKQRKKNENKHNTYLQHINNLQMQIDILVEQIKNLTQNRL